MTPFGYEDWVRIDKAIRNINIILEDFKGQERTILLERANYFRPNVEDKCSHCICKTCLIAEQNGGAPGCGNCKSCQRNDYNLFCQSCFDYYNPKY